MSEPRQYFLIVEGEGTEYFGPTTESEVNRLLELVERDYPTLCPSIEVIQPSRPRAYMHAALRDLAPERTDR